MEWSNSEVRPVPVGSSSFALDLRRLLEAPPTRSPWDRSHTTASMAAFFLASAFTLNGAAVAPKPPGGLPEKWTEQENGPWEG